MIGRQAECIRNPGLLMLAQAAGPYFFSPYPLTV
jgi:hypothetical protein